MIAGILIRVTSLGETYTYRHELLPNYDAVRFENMMCLTVMCDRITLDVELRMNDSNIRCVRTDLVKCIAGWLKQRIKEGESPLTEARVRVSDGRSSWWHYYYNKTYFIIIIFNFCELIFIYFQYR